LTPPKGGIGQVIGKGSLFARPIIDNDRDFYHVVAALRFLFGRFGNRPGVPR
jgi:hypothetical protein